MDQVVPGRKDLKPILPASLSKQTYNMDRNAGIKIDGHMIGLIHIIPILLDL